MKTLVTIAIACALVIAQGCTRNDRDSAGLKREPGVPPTEAQPVPNSATEQASQVDPAANGGLSLGAAAPYAGSAVSQNVNPGPFLTAGQAQTGTASTLPATGMLTRSADGTMSGPNDLPAATTGWGTAAATYGPAAAPTKSGPTRAKSSTPRK